MVAALVMIECSLAATPRVAEEVAEIKGVSEAYSVSGEWDIVAVVRVPEWERIVDVVTEHIAAVDGIEETETLIAFRVYSSNELSAAYSWE